MAEGRRETGGGGPSVLPLLCEGLPWDEGKARLEGGRSYFASCDS